MNQYKVRMIYLSQLGEHSISSMFKKITEKEIQPLVDELKKAQKAIESDNEVNKFYQRNPKIDEQIIGNYLLTHETDETSYQIPLAVEFLDQENKLTIHVLNPGEYCGY